MLINLRNAMMGGKRKPTAKDYSYDLALWDAIENAGYGIHNPSATSITNLLGGGLDIALSGNYNVNANNIRFDGGYGTAAKYNFTGATGVTISVLASYDSATALNAQGWSVASTAPRIAAYYERGYWYVSSNTNAVGHGIAHVMPTNTVCKYDFVWDASSQRVSVYFGGALVGTLATAVVLGDVQSHFRMMAYGSATNTNYQTYKGNIYNCAVSTRVLTADEIAHNYAIDKVRFNLPTA